MEIMIPNKYKKCVQLVELHAFAYFLLFIGII